MKKAIQTDFPFEQLNIVAELESWRKEINRPMYHIHKWWAQRLGSVFRTILLSALAGEDQDIWDLFYRGFNAKDAVILDPFMGSGTTLGEALKLNASVIGCDINPVSYFLVQKGLEDVNIPHLKDAYRRLENRVKSRIHSYYNTIYESTGERADILYTFWVMQAPCPDCGDLVPLFNKYIFSSNAYPNRKPLVRVICPKCWQVFDANYYDESVTCPGCGDNFNPGNGTAARTKFHCKRCGSWHPIQKTIRDTGKPPSYKMYANMLWLESGQKAYSRITDRDQELFATAKHDLLSNGLPIPEDIIPPGHNTNQARGYNFLFWKELFNERQLNSLSILLDGIEKEQDTSLREFMLILFSSCLEFNSMFCSFKGEGTGAVRHMFYHHILKPERTPLENTIWGFSKSSGTFSTLFRSRLIKAKEYQKSPFELAAIPSNNGKYKSEKKFINGAIKTKLTDDCQDILKGKANTLLIRGDSSSLPVPDKIVDAVVTDPPYFDFVHYSELADYFYAWLRIPLSQYHSAFQHETSRNDEEVQSTNNEVFKTNLCRVFAESNRVLKDEGLLVFTFHHSRLEGWDAIYRAVREAGFVVLAAYPMKAEMSVATPKNQAKEPINLDSILVCGKRNGRIERDWTVLESQLVETARNYVERFNAAGKILSKGDVRVIVTGECLVALSTFQGKSRPLPELEDYLNSLTESLCSAQSPARVKISDTKQKKMFG